MVVARVVNLVELSRKVRPLTSLNHTPSPLIDLSCRTATVPPQVSAAQMAAALTGLHVCVDDLLEGHTGACVVPGCDGKLAIVCGENAVHIVHTLWRGLPLGYKSHCPHLLMVHRDWRRGRSCAGGAIVGLRPAQGLQGVKADPTPGRLGPDPPTPVAYMIMNQNI